MKKKTPWIISLVISIVSLVVGASFHSLRVHPENKAGYNLGCTMGITMATLAAVSFVAFLVFFIIYKKSIKKNPEE